jgi:deazaflavin-dependent oxidoreductase (nitroreductase family)
VSVASTRDPIRVARRSNALANGRPRWVRRWSRLHARLYRLTRGRFVPRWFGAPVLVLETVGRRSGKRRATPVLYLRDGASVVVLAANAGAHRTPAWWLNLRAAGEAEVVVGAERRRVRPRVLSGEEREPLWRAFVAMYSQAREYERLTTRELPLVALEPV